ncbi:hypothetical protein [Nocardia sp. NPDC051570]|uniref:hypothetical protein n=1 Tax=Nocardia sp. NPDC051570 TaxID=3364324 RepID=UPI0037BB2D21
MGMPDDDKTYRTEADGWSVVWRLDHGAIQILWVARVGEPGPLAVFDPTEPPDLVDMRERWPKLAPLWDAVRREYWAGPTSAQSPRIRQLTERAKRAGYRLVRESPMPYVWLLADVIDGEQVHVADTLDDVERWLET